MKYAIVLATVLVVSTAQFARPSTQAPVKPVVAEDAYSYITPDGELIPIRYIADQNGFQPEGDAIPTPPAIPEAILRALKYIEKTSPQIKN